MPSKWSDVLGVLWVPSTLPTHFFARVAFMSGVLSAPSRLLEPVNPFAHGFTKSLIFAAPGFPSVLIIGDAAIELLDRRFEGRVKEAAGEDPFGRPCVEALATLGSVLETGTKFAPPVFDTLMDPEPAMALDSRRIS